MIRRVLSSMKASAEALVSFPAYGIFWITIFYAITAVVLELKAPQCLFVFEGGDETPVESNSTLVPSEGSEESLEETERSACLQRGVDNSTSTILTGFLASTWMFGLALHLWSIKCCYIPRWDAEAECFVHNDYKGNVRPSGIHALTWGGISVLLSSLAKVLQPNAAVGQTIYWSLTSTSYLAMAFSIYSHGYFALRSVNQRLRICCSCFSRVGLTVGLVMVCALLLLGAGLSCALLVGVDPDQGDSASLSNATANATTTDSIFDNSEEMVQVSSALFVGEENVFEHNGGGRWLQEQEAEGEETIAPTSADTLSAMTIGEEDNELEILPFELEHVCQDISYYGNFVFAFCSFFFWYAVSKVLRRGARKHKYNLSGTFEEETRVFGLDILTGITLMPWISFAFGNLYPVWVWLAADFSNNYWLEVALWAKSGLVQHYGLIIMALLSHNWFKTMTYSVHDPTRFRHELFHDLTLGAFEKPGAKKPNPQDQETIFNDLTLGVFDSNSKKSSATSTARDDDSYDYYNDGY